MDVFNAIINKLMNYIKQDNCHQITNPVTPGNDMEDVITPGNDIQDVKSDDIEDVITPGNDMEDVTTPGNDIEDVTTPGNDMEDVTTPGNDLEDEKYDDIDHPPKQFDLQLYKYILKQLPNIPQSIRIETCINLIQYCHNLIINCNESV